MYISHYFRIAFLIAKMKKKYAIVFVIFFHMKVFFIVYFPSEASASVLLCLSKLFLFRLVRNLSFVMKLIFFAGTAFCHRYGLLARI